MISIVEGKDVIMSDGGYCDATFVRTPNGWRVDGLTGGLVWWEDGDPGGAKPAWWGVSRERFGTAGLKT